MIKNFTMLIACLVILLPGSALAQQYTLSGTVTDSRTGERLIGANLFIADLNRGATTNVDGEYSISQLSDGTYLLQVSYVGYQSLIQSVTIDGTNKVLNFRLVADDVDLDQVVIVGFGTQSRRNVTGAISSVTAEEIANVPVNTVESAIQGRTPGVFVQRETGKLGGATQMRIRGASSVTASNQPLYVVDGIPVTMTDFSDIASSTNPLADINFNDVESIEILKDASAAAIYGSRASNGVILITTKRGREGRTQFTYNFQAGWSAPTRLRDWMNTAEYIQHFEEAAMNLDRIEGGGDFWLGFVRNRFNLYSAGQYTHADGWANGQVIDVDWQQEAFQSGAGVVRHELSARGGTANTRYYVSGHYSDETGILIGNDFERISGRVNLDHQANDWISLGMNLSLGRSVMNRVSTDNAFATPMQLVAQPPLTPIRDPRTCMDAAGEMIPGCTPELSGDFTLYYNGLLHRDFASYETTVYRNLGSAYVNFQLMDNLFLRSEYGVDILTQHEDQYYGSRTARGVGGNEGQGLGVSRWSQALNYNVNTFANHRFQLDDIHDIESVVGFSYEQYTQDITLAEGRGFPNDNFRKLASSAEPLIASGTATKYSFLSYFARVNYSLMDRYLLTVSGRVDGSSRFGSNNRYGFFPAVSAGWIMTEEDFFRGVDFLSFLKLRASYGVTGNAAIGNFESRGLFGGGSYNNISAIQPSQTPNPDLKWEQTSQTDIGLDFGLFNNRLRGEVDYYWKNTKDLLLRVNVPSSTGFGTQLRNVGKLDNEGFEANLTTINLMGEFQWTTRLNFATNKNKITDLDGQILEGAFINRAVEGESIGVFFAPEYAGVDPETGDALFYLNSGDNPRETTNVYGDAERVVIGDPNPKWTGGFGNTFSWKGLELDVFFQFVYGNDVYTGGSGRFTTANGDWLDNQTRDQLNSWRNPGDITDVPEARFLEANGTGHSSRYISDGSYLRLKTLTLSYTLPRSVIQRANIDRVRLYATGVNLLTFTSYDGWDPEVNTDFLAGNIGLGNEFYSAPQARTFTIGVEIGF